MSGTEEVRSQITWLGSTHYVFWRFSGTPETWVFRHPQRIGWWNVWLSPCPPCHFSGKSRPGTSKGVGSVHTDLAPLACDIYCLKSPTLRRDPHLCSPCLKMTNISWTRGLTLLCPTLSFLTGSYKLCSWSWAPSGMLMRKERYQPSFSFLPYQIHKQIILPFPSTCFLLPSISLPTHSLP